VLVIILIFFFSNGLDSFYKLFPSFGNQSVNVTGVAKVRYDISLDQSTYYDGNAWASFSKEGSIELEGMTVSYDQVYKAFVDFYFNKANRAQKEVQLNGNYMISIDQIVKASVDNTKQPWYIFVNTKRTAAAINGNVIINLKTVNGVQLGFFVLDTNNALSYFGTDQKTVSPIDSSPDLIMKVKNEAISWKNSVFAKPIMISYKTDSNGLNNGYFCVVPYDNIYLVTDLSNEVNSDDPCV